MELGIGYDKDFKHDEEQGEYTFWNGAKLSVLPAYGLSKTMTLVFSQPTNPKWVAMALSYRSKQDHETDEAIIKELGK